MLRPRGAGWGVGAGGSPPRDSSDDSPLDVVGATGTCTGRPVLATRFDELTLEGRQFGADASTTRFRGTNETFSPAPTSTSASTSPGHDVQLSARAKQELAQDLRQMHARINDSKQAKLASDKLRLYVESRKLKTENAMVKKQAGVRLAMPLARRVDDDTDAIRVAAARALAAGVRRATPRCALELKSWNLKSIRGDEKLERKSKLKFEMTKPVGRRPARLVPNNTDSPNFVPSNISPTSAAVTSQFHFAKFGGRPSVLNRNGRNALRNISNATHRRDGAGASSVGQTSSLGATRSTKSSVGSSTKESLFSPLAVRGEASAVWCVSRDAAGALVSHAHGALVDTGSSLSTTASTEPKHDSHPTLSFGLRAPTGTPALTGTSTKTLTGKIPSFDDDGGYRGVGTFTFERHGLDGDDEDDDDDNNEDDDDDGDDANAFATSSQSGTFDLFETARCDLDVSTSVSDPGSVEYDFPSPAPSAAAAFIGRGKYKTSPAGSCGSATPGTGGTETKSPRHTCPRAGFTPGDGAAFVTPDEPQCSRFTMRTGLLGGLDTRATANMAALTFGLERCGFGSGFEVGKDARGDKKESDEDADSEFDSDCGGYSFDGFEGLQTPGLPDFTPTKVDAIETPWTGKAKRMTNGVTAPSPRTAAIALETETGMAVRIQAAFRGLLGRIRARKVRGG